MQYYDHFRDKLAIRELQELYADAVNQKNKNQWIMLWDEGANWIVAGQNNIGIEAIADKWDDFYTPYNPKRGNLTRFYSCNPGFISINNDLATSRLYISVLIIFDIGIEKIYYFESNEEYIKCDSLWKIMKRNTIRIHPSSVL